ncbi:MAG: hypothetical protein JWM11_1787 [Planctomycetaceae bacterium]|nr:hypothetical protein [Planctomycetaceae bacterium]
MFDIYLGLAVSLTVSAVAFGIAYHCGRSASQQLVNLLTTALVLLLVLYIRDMWNSHTVATFLPYSNLIVIGNWLAPAVAVLGGLAWHRLPGQFCRRAILVGSMLMVAGYSLVHPLRGEVPHCDDLWENGVCLQSTNASCSPASAATLLRCYNIPATEQEMAELCLTRKEGTHWQGLYRGLKLKTVGTPWDVEVFSGTTIDELRTRAEYGPVILTVGLPKDFRPASAYQQDWGWIPGVSHSVVLFKFYTIEMANIGDPSVAEGRENWTETDLRILWQGRGIRLVPRDKSPDTLIALSKPVFRKNSDIFKHVRGLTTSF